MLIVSGDSTIPQFSFRHGNQSSQIMPGGMVCAVSQGVTPMSLSKVRQILMAQFSSSARLGIAILVVTLLIFTVSRVHQVADSSYSMMLSQSLLDHRSFTLDGYALPHNPTWVGDHFTDGNIYQLEMVGDHIYYHFPPGSSVLSVPFVALLRLFGVSAVNADGTYNPNGEAKIEAGLAALLMATLASLFFFTARLLLPPGWSVIVAAAAALGTQVYSTASRALWSDTWGILLLAVAIFMLLAHEVGKRELNPILMASVLSWAYFVRPTFSVPVAAITLYILIFQGKLFVRYALTGGVWLGGFILFSWTHYGRLVPTYYHAGRLQFDLFWTALAGNLISPARGLLVYVPTLFFVAFLLARYRRRVSHARLVWLAVSVTIVHIILVSGFNHWWGGHSFGPRLTTSLVPWFVLLAILGIEAMLKWRNERAKKSLPLTGWRTQLILGGALLLLSMTIHTLGATSHATWLWNVRPRGVDEHPERLWDWRQPQFLAGLLPYPPPQTFPPVEFPHIDFSKPESDKYFWYGWNEGPPDSRWSDKKAAIVFSLTEIKLTSVRINLRPYLVPGKLDEQPLSVSLNGQLLATFTLRAPETVVLPISSTREHNVLVLELPKAESPQKLGAGDDPRLRGIKLDWIEFETATAGK